MSEIITSGEMRDLWADIKNNTEQLDIDLSALRDSITASGENATTLNNLYNKIEETRVLLNNIAAKDFATEDKQDTLIGHAFEMKSFIYSMLQQIATEDKQDALAALIGALTATAETDPTQSASQIALLKGILKQLQGDGAKPNVTQLSGSNVPDTSPIPNKNINKKILTTIINAVSVAAGASTNVTNLGLDGTEDEVWLAVNIDKHPWTLATKGVFGSDLSSATTYPVYLNNTNIFTVISLPALALVLGLRTGVTGGLTAPASLIEAKEQRIPLDSTISCTIRNNHATDIATVTVKVLRIWR